jgi:hypothetical protein
MFSGFARHILLAVMLVPLGSCSVISPIAEATGSLVVPTSRIDNRQVSRRACIGHTAHFHAHLTQADGEAILDREVEALRRAVDESLAYRTRTIARAESLRAKSGRREPFSGEDIAALKQAEVDHLALRKRLYRFVEAHECWLDGPEVAGVRVAPPQRLKGIMLSLSAALCPCPRPWCFTTITCWPCPCTRNPPGFAACSTTRTWVTASATGH